MKLLVLSDSHRNIDHMQYAVVQTKPDAILHLGDHISDAYELQHRNPDTVFYMVKGNNDWYGDGENELLLTIEGVKIFMTHGHTYNVKYGLDDFINRARHHEADLALFGHTHQAMVRQTPGLWLLNPGQMCIHGNRIAASYGIVTIRDGSFDCNTVILPQADKQKSR